MTAARRLDKIAPGLVDEYLRKHAGSTRRGRALSSTVKRAQAGGRDHAPRPISVFQRRLAAVARDETGDGRAIVDFIADVMYGTITGFKPYHRLEAATELAAYILHDESYLPTPTPWFPNSKPTKPENKIVVPAKAGTHPQTVTTEPEPVSAETVTDETDNETVVPAKAGTHPETAHGEPTKTVRPEPVEGQCSAKTPSPEPAEAPRAEHEAVHAEPESVHAEPVEAPQLPTNNQKLTTNNHPLAPELSRYIARAQNGTDLRMQHWQEAYDALIARSRKRRRHRTTPMAHRPGPRTRQPVHMGRRRHTPRGHIPARDRLRLHGPRRPHRPRDRLHTLARPPPPQHPLYAAMLGGLRRPPAQPRPQAHKHRAHHRRAPHRTETQGPESPGPLAQIRPHLPIPLRPPLQPQRPLTPRVKPPLP